LSMTQVTNRLKLIGEPLRLALDSRESASHQRPGKRCIFVHFKREREEMRGEEKRGQERTREEKRRKRRRRRGEAR
jgi:hypothetical protein